MEIGRHFPSTNLSLLILFLYPSSCRFSPKVALMVLPQCVSQFFEHLITIFNLRIHSTGCSIKIERCRYHTRSRHWGQTHCHFQREGACLCHWQGIDSYLYTMVTLTFNLFEFIFRVCYSLEGHSFWVPTATYDTIVSYPPVNHGKKSKSYNELWDGLPGAEGQICWASIA